MERNDLKRYRLPDSPGVYLFKKGRKILYIGKAASLRDRVRSYFSNDLVEARSPAIAGMVEKTTSVAWRETDSVLEALILEANLIKKHQPAYNTDGKDDKSWNYVVITREEFPRVLLVRGRDLSSGSQEATGYKLQAIYGPFPHGGQLREALKMVRRIFPFRDTCAPCNLESSISGFSISGFTKPRYRGFVNPDIGKCRACFNRQIGLCPGMCSGEIGKDEYAKTIRNIRDLFSGTFKGLKRRLATEMKAAAKAEDFERAVALRRQISALDHVRDVSLIKGERRIVPGGRIRNGAYRIEAYDIAHTSGADVVGVMTVVEDGEKTKSEYRKFRVRDAANDDTRSLREVLARRLAHPEWRMPRLVVVDGSTAQVRAAKRVLDGAGVDIPVVGVVKNAAHKPERLIGDAAAIREHEHAILLANAEAHRFAVSFHRARRGRLT